MSDERNTRFAYLYRDGSNCKQYASVVLEGMLRFEDIAPFLDEGEYFIAADVDLEDLQLEWARTGHVFPNDEDHVWSEIHPEDIEPTDDEPTADVTAEELLAAFRRIGGRWDVAAAEKRLGIQYGDPALTQENDER